MKHLTPNNSGMGILGIFGSLGVLVLIVVGILNAIQYHEMKQRLQTLATSAASVAATFLPDPVRACTEAHRFVQEMGDVQMGGISTPVSILVSAIRLHHQNGTPLPGRLSLHFNAGSCMIPVVNPGPGVVKTLDITLSGQLSSPFLPGILGLNNLNVYVEAKAELVPTDIVLVIDNSNSVVSPINQIISSAGQNWEGLVPWDDWENKVAIKARGSNGEVIALSKADVYARQCFGDVTRSIKRAALKLYDLLSVSGSFRIGVVHTTDTILGDVQGTIQLSQSPLAPVVIHPDNTLRGPGDSYGMTDYEDTRCMALTGNLSLAPVPAYPFPSSYTGVINSYSDLTPRLTNTIPGPDGPMNVSASNIFLAINYPRDLIWINSAGVNSSSGALDPRFDSAQIPLSIVKAAQMLRTAPQRPDGAPVQRRMIIVLTDGVDQPNSYTGITTWEHGAEFPETQFVHGGEGAAITYTQRRSQDFPQYYCSQDNSNPIFQYTNPDQFNDNENARRQAIKLGVVFFRPSEDSYRFEIGVEPQDPMRHINQLFGHSESQEDQDVRAAFEAECGTQSWNPFSGTFTMRAETSEELIDGVVPDIARTLFVGSTGL